MRQASRRGFTLIELLVALILLVIVGGGLYQVLLTVQRVSGKQAAVSNLHGNLRTGIQLIQSELAEVSTNSVAPSSDIESMSATAFRYRAMRGIGEVCEAPSVSTVKIRQLTWGGRQLTPGTDSLYIYLDKDTTKTSDDEWLPESFSGVASSTCPDGGAAWTLTLGTNLNATQFGQLWTPSPIRTWEPMEIGSVTDNGQLWLGMRKVMSENTLVPVVGPLDAGGLDMRYYDAGSQTANVNLVKTIWITLRGITDRTVNTGVGSALGTVKDTLQVRVELRNSK